MTASGRLRRFCGFCGMSAYPPKLTVEADIPDQTTSSSFDHLVGAGEQHGWDGESHCLRRDRVDDEVEFGGLLNWNFTCLRSVQNLVDQFGCPAPHVRPIRSIGDQTAGFDVFPHGVYRRESRTQRERADTYPVYEQDGIGQDVPRLGATLERIESVSDVFDTLNFKGTDFQVEVTCGSLNLAYVHGAEGIVDICQDCQPAQTGNEIAQEF